MHFPFKVSHFLLLTGQVLITLSCWRCIFIGRVKSDGSCTSCSDLHIFTKVVHLFVFKIHCVVHRFVIFFCFCFQVYFLLSLQYAVETALILGKVKIVIKKKRFGTASWFHEPTVTLSSYYAPPCFFHFLLTAKRKGMLHPLKRIFLNCKSTTEYYFFVHFAVPVWL